MSLAKIVSSKCNEIEELKDKIDKLEKEIEQILPTTTLSGHKLIIEETGGMLIITEDKKYVDFFDVKALYEFLQKYFEDRLPEQEGKN